jgi:serine/threonine protein kinase
MPSSQSRPEAPPTLQGRYRLIRTLEASEHGASFLGYDLRLQRWRTIDVPADEAASRRLKNEAELLARLEHPAVERVVDVGDDGGIWFVVRDRLHGSAAEHLPMPVPLAASLIMRISDGLAHAHSRGIFHGHVRPSVMRFSEDGGPVLVGFGRAPRLDGTTTGRQSEPWAYLAPEQRGVFQPDGAAEVYSLGALLYTLIAGRSQADLFYAEAYDGLLAPIPMALRPLMLKACAYNPSERPQDVEAFRNLLAGRMDLLGPVGGLTWKVETLPNHPPEQIQPDPPLMGLMSLLGGRPAEARARPVEGENSASTMDSESKRSYSMPRIMPATTGFRDPFAYVDPSELPDYVDPVARASMPRQQVIGLEPPKATPPPAPSRGLGSKLFVPLASVAAVFGLSALGFSLVVMLGLGAVAVFEAHEDRKFVSAVLAERSLVEVLASTSEDRVELERAWFRFADDPTAENAAAYVRLATAAARAETASLEAKSAADRLEAALGDWKGK